MQPASTHRESRRRVRAVICLIALAALSAPVLAGCGAGGAASTNSVAESGGAVPAPAAGGPNLAPGDKKNVAGAASSPGAAARSATGTAVPEVGPKLTKSASLDVQVTNIDVAAARVRAIATGLAAQVLNEQIGTGITGGPGQPVPLQNQSQDQGQPRTQSTPQAQGSPLAQPGSAGLSGFGTLTLSVPAAQLDTALDQLARIGTVLQRNVSTQDVTAQYVDTASRLNTMRASVARVRALMAQAKDLGQVVALEGELSRREADLESLESQLEALKNGVDRSTLTISLSTPGNPPVVENGFVAGLRSGWDAFAASAGRLLTALGAVLPFAVFVALAAAPVIWWFRRSRLAPPPRATE